MNKEFVPYEEALALKEIGYKGDIIGVYDEDKYLFTLREQDDVEEEWIIAPTYSQAFRWFREKHGYYWLPIKNHDNNWSYVIRDVKDYYYDISMAGNDTHEEAELACLRKLIEIVNQNKDE